VEVRRVTDSFHRIPPSGVRLHALEAK
jgi:hypothetical protein